MSIVFSLSLILSDAQRGTTVNTHSSLGCLWSYHRTFGATGLIGSDFDFGFGSLGASLLFHLYSYLYVSWSLVIRLRSSLNPFVFNVNLKVLLSIIHIKRHSCQLHFHVKYRLLKCFVSYVFYLRTYLILFAFVQILNFSFMFNFNVESQF